MYIALSAFLVLFIRPEWTLRLLKWLFRRQAAAVRPDFERRHEDWSSLIPHVRGLPFGSKWSFDDCIVRKEELWHLDLHGLDVRGAELAIPAFVHDARRQGITRCRIITGRGNRSKGAAKLFPRAAIVLRTLQNEVRHMKWSAEDGSYLVSFQEDR